MKKQTKKLAAAALAAALSLASAMTSFAFYQEPASKKGLLISQQHMFDDVLEPATRIWTLICPWRRTARTTASPLP